MTAGAIGGYIFLVLGLLITISVGGLFSISVDDYTERALGAVATFAVGIIIVALFWWGMAFTTSSEYHSWNSKSGVVERVSKRLISDGKGMKERYVFVIDGTPYGVDDTRAALVRAGDTVNLKCKKDYQWGIDRKFQGWVCRWNSLTV